MFYFLPYISDIVFIFQHGRSTESQCCVNSFRQIVLLLPVRRPFGLWLSVFFGVKWLKDNYDDDDKQGYPALMKIMIKTTRAVFWKPRNKKKRKRFEEDLSVIVWVIWTSEVFFSILKYFQRLQQSSHRGFRSRTCEFSEMSLKTRSDAKGRKCEIW